MGFKITRDFVEDDKSRSQVGNESIRQSGVKALFMSEKDQQDCEYNGGKIKVRLRDEDGNIHYHAFVDNNELSYDLLYNWGMTNSGAVIIDMHIDSYKELHGEPKYKESISKDGKWYSYIS